MITVKNAPEQCPPDKMSRSSHVGHTGHSAAPFLTSIRNRGDVWRLGRLTVLTGWARPGLAVIDLHCSAAAVLALHQYTPQPPGRPDFFLTAETLHEKKKFQEKFWNF
jgi:hypothetical protein